MHQDVTGEFSALGTQRPGAIRAVRVERQGAAPLVLSLYPDVEYRFGRSGDASVVFQDDAVSRQHGALWCNTQMQWVYRDLSSRNGTFRVPRGRPDERVEVKGSTPVVLEAGDALLLGTERARLVLLDEAPEGTTRESEQHVLNSEAAKSLEEQVCRVAQHERPVVLFGPSGSGKTFTARRIHDLSRRKGPFIAINCGRLPRESAALQSELLGHVKGAYTGAVGERVGKLFAAANGTLFLDEVESLPREAQDFLIDVLEGTGTFAPLGAPPDSHPEAPRFRLVVATKTVLAKAPLRADLVQRLMGVPLVIPTLEERPEDIPALVRQCLARLQKTHGYEADVTPEGMALLQAQPWPGQVRELFGLVENVTAQLAADRTTHSLENRRLVMGVGALRQHLDARAQILGQPIEAVPTSTLTMGTPTAARRRPADLTKDELQAALTASGGNKTRAAQALGIALNTLKRRLREVGLVGVPRGDRAK